MSILTWLILFVVAVVVAAIVAAIITSNKQKEIGASIAALPGFTATYEFRGADGANGIAIDEPNGKVCLLRRDRGIVTNRVVTYRDIISAELVEDGETITKTVRSSQIGGALVGGLLLGGVGAVIGGLSGKRVEKGKVKRIDLRLVVNDSARPTHDVCFLATETNRDGFVYRTSAGQAQQWLARMDVLIRRAERQEASSGQQQAEKPVALSRSDELTKLVRLLNARILTYPEFDAREAKPLSGKLFCSQCGAQLGEGSKFCHSCGHKL